MSEELESHMDARANGSGQAVNIHMPRESTWKHPAIYVAILALIIAFWGEREARLSEYYGVDLEMYMAKNGLHPPPDPWGKSKEGQPK